MRREASLEEISDGKLYHLSDMVKTDCGGCDGCFACCMGMGHSIVLDPQDIYQLTTNLHQSFEQLLADAVELHMFDGVILPTLKMSGEDERCFFLNAEGRCEIHGFRPGICRLFPLGRFYEGNTFSYFLQTKECKKENRSKIKVKNWIDIPNIKEYDAFIMKWHDFIKDLQEKLIGKEELIVKKMDMFLLQQFFLEKYNPLEDFYTQFYARLEKAQQVITLLLQGQ